MLSPDRCLWRAGKRRGKREGQGRGLAVRRLSITMLSAALLGLAWPALAQEQAAPTIAADPDTIQFDLDQVEDDNDDWGIAEFRARQNASQAASCGSDSELLAAQSTSSPRYDDNGALIREAPSADCVPPGSRYGRLSQAVRAEEQRRAQASAGDRTAFLRQPECEESANGYRCASSGTAGRNTYEREQECDETGNTRTCSSSFSIGNSTEGRNAAQEAIDRLRDD